MTVELSQRSLEEAIECGWLQHGPNACAQDATGFGTPAQPPCGGGAHGVFRQRRFEDYDRVLSLLQRDMTDFILAMQPKEWQKLAQHYEVAARKQFLECVASEVGRHGTLDVLRSGSRILGSNSSSRTSGRRAHSMKRRCGCIKRTCSPSCASSATARRTRTALTSCCS